MRCIERTLPCLSKKSKEEGVRTQSKCNEQSVEDSNSADSSRREEYALTFHSSTIFVESEDVSREHF